MLIEGCMYVYVDLCGFMALVGYLESECPTLSGYFCVCVCVCVSHFVVVWKNPRRDAPVAVNV